MFLQDRCAPCFLLTSHHNIDCVLQSYLSMCIPDLESVLLPEQLLPEYLLLCQSPRCQQPSLCSHPLSPYLPQFPCSHSLPLYQKRCPCLFPQFRCLLSFLCFLPAHSHLLLCCSPGHKKSPPPRWKKRLQEVREWQKTFSLLSFSLSLLQISKNNNSFFQRKVGLLNDLIYFLISLWYNQITKGATDRRLARCFS